MMNDEDKKMLSALIAAFDNADGITVFDTNGNSVQALYRGQAFKITYSSVDVGTLDVGRYEGLGVLASVSPHGWAKEVWEAVQDAYIDGLHRYLKRVIGIGNIESLPPRLKSYALRNLDKLHGR